AYFAWRSIYFERLLPNTVLCKAAWQGHPWALVLPFASLAWPAALLGVLARRHAGNAAIAALVVAYIAALHGADPVVGAHNRHFLAVLGPLLVLATAGATSLLSRLPRMTSAAAETIVAVGVALVVFDRLPE